MDEKDIIHIIIKNLHGETIHIEAIEKLTTTDIFRGVSELNQLYTLSLELNSSKQIMVWKEEE